MKQTLKIIIALAIILLLPIQIYASGPSIPTELADQILTSECSLESANIEYANTNEYGLLSELSEEECIAFVKEYGIEIPSEYDEMYWAPFVQMVIKEVEGNPNYVFRYNYTVSLSFANEIKMP